MATWRKARFRLRLAEARALGLRACSAVFILDHYRNYYLKRYYLESLFYAYKEALDKGENGLIDLLVNIYPDNDIGFVKLLLRQAGYKSEIYLSY